MLQLGHKQDELYQQAMQLAKAIYQITALFPDTERAVLVYSLRRLAALLCQDIATGSGKKNKKRKQAFQLCLNHCVALDAQLELAVTVNLVPHEHIHEAEQHLDAVYKKLVAGLHQS